MTTTDTERCASWCYLDRHDGPCRARVADHPLSPGGRIGLAEVVDRHRNGKVTYQSNRHGAGLGYIASGTAMVLEDRGLIENVSEGPLAGPKWAPTALGLALHDALEDES